MNEDKNRLVQTLLRQGRDETAGRVDALSNDQFEARKRDVLLRFASELVARR
jgi:hypothetical protein